MPDRTFNVLFPSINLPLRGIDKLSLGIKVCEIGRSKGATSYRNDVA